MARSGVAARIALLDAAGRLFAVPRCRPPESVSDRPRRVSGCIDAWTVKHPTADLVTRVLTDAQNRGVSIYPTDCSRRTELNFAGEVPFGPEPGTVSIGFERQPDHSAQVVMRVTNTVPDNVGGAGDTGPFYPMPQPVVDRHDWPPPICTKIP